MQVCSFPYSWQTVTRWAVSSSFCLHTRVFLQQDECSNVRAQDVFCCFEAAGRE
jgi:hypothetical protein